jgi:hypothetical protein
MTRQEILRHLIINTVIAFAGFVSWFLSAPGGAAASTDKSSMLATGRAAVIWVLVLT